MLRGLPDIEDSLCPTFWTCINNTKCGKHRIDTRSVDVFVDGTHITYILALTICRTCQYIACFYTMPSGKIIILRLHNWHNIYKYYNIEYIEPHMSLFRHDPKLYEKLDKELYLKYYTTYYSKPGTLQSYAVHNIKFDDVFITKYKQKVNPNLYNIIYHRHGKITEKLL